MERRDVRKELKGLGFEFDKDRQCFVKKVGYLEFLLSVEAATYSTEADLAKAVKRLESRLKQPWG